MKRKIVFCIMVICFLFLNTNYSYAGCGINKKDYTYEVSGDKVYFKSSFVYEFCGSSSVENIELLGVDVGTFELINLDLCEKEPSPGRIIFPNFYKCFPYAKDKNNFYYEGKIIKGFMPSSKLSLLSELMHDFDINEYELDSSSLGKSTKKRYNVNSEPVGSNSVLEEYFVVIYSIVMGIFLIILVYVSRKVLKIFYNKNAKI